jgi:hypothetical protein
MRLMRDKHIANLETKLEQLIEGAFTRLFGRKVRAQDIALQLARSMESNLHPAANDDPRPIAPDHFTIWLGEDTAHHLLAHRPNLPAILSEYMLELATGAGYRLEVTPLIDIQPKPGLANETIQIEAIHTSDSVSSTHILERVQVTHEPPPPVDASLVIKDRIVPLNQTMMTIGRNLDNDIVLQDKHVSRHHAQVRLRFGRFTLFDVQSSTGTFVNDQQIQQHQLVNGDVIRLGGVRVVYLEAQDDNENSTVDMPPVAPGEI